MNLMEVITKFLASFKPVQPGPVEDMDLTPFPIGPDEMRERVIAAGCAPATAGVVASAYTRAFMRFGVSGSLTVAHVLANCAVESQNFTRVRENLNYRSAARIREIFGKNKGIYTLSGAQVEALVNNPEALANVVYADSNRSINHKLGNRNPGDGWKFHGWGWPQLTGRDVIKSFGRYVNMSTDEVLARTDPDINALAALWFATVYKRGFIEAAQSDNVLRTRQIWNGGETGLDEVRNKLNSIKRVMNL